MNKFIVVHVTNYYFPTLGGITTQVSYLKKMFEKENARVIVLPFPYIFRKIESLIFINFIRRIIHFIFVSMFILYSELLMVLVRLTNKKVIVHSHDAYFCALIGIISKFFGCKSVHTIRTDLKFRSALKFKKLQTIIYNHCDTITFVSEFMLSEFRKEFPHVNRRLRITYSGIDLDKFHPESSELLSYYMEKKGPIILFVGNLVRQKGPLVLIDAIKHVKKKFPNITLFLVGEGDLKEEIRRIIIRSGLTDNIFLVGTIPRGHLLQYYSLCDVFVLPTFMEAFGNSIVEAMACGKPVIATRIGGIPEIIIDKINGIFVEPGNPDSLAKHIEELLADKKLYNGISSKSRTSIANKFSWDKLVQMYKNCYLEVYD